MLEVVKEVPNWVAAIMASASTAGFARLIRAWRDYRVAVDDDERSDFESVTRQYRALVDRLGTDLSELRTEVDELKQTNEQRGAVIRELQRQNVECMAKNGQLEAEIAQLRQRFDMMGLGKKVTRRRKRAK